MKNSEEFMELMRVMASCIGSPRNPSKLENTFKSVKNENLDRKTISKYLSYMEDAFLIEKSMRYDIKGRRIDDSFKKIIIMRDDIKPYHDNNGFYIVGVMDFLLKPDLMEQL